MEGARHGVGSEPGGGGGVLVDSETRKGAEAYVGRLGVSAAYQVAQTVADSEISWRNTHESDHTRNIPCVTSCT